MHNRYSSPDFELAYTYHGQDLGAAWSEDETRFRVWAPEADAVSVLLHASGDPADRKTFRDIPMNAAENGTWQLSLDGDLNGVYYTYRVRRGNACQETCDPYARAAGLNGELSMVVDLAGTDPEGWEKDCSPCRAQEPTDYAIYEMHLRDISAGHDTGIRHPGKYIGVCEEDTRSSLGYPTGLSHIRSLGVTHVHLLPVYDFGSVDERTCKGYNWGYDPVNYNVPEGSYATDPCNGAVRIRELKQLVQTFHRSGLGVVLDVVYNHVYHTNGFSINRLVPGYFCRQNSRGKLSNASGCGNDTASERSMVRKFIVDSVCYWADEYHIDGFRFDLVGLLDLETIQELIQKVHRKHPHVLFYGEGWDMPTAVTKAGTQLTTQKNAARIPSFAFFNDTMRDTLRGSVFYPEETGFVSGKPTDHRHLLNCFCGRTAWTEFPSQIVNYISCHDNHTLHDRLALSLPHAGEQELARRCRMAAAFNLLSMGIPFFQAGEELLRSKKDAAGGFVADSYRSGDAVNAIRYNSLQDPDVADTLRYYRGLLHLRKAHPLFRQSDPAAIQNSVHLLDTGKEDITGFLLADSEERIIILWNTAIVPHAWRLPDGEWQNVVHGRYAGAETLRVCSGIVSLEGLCASVFIQQQ